MNDEDLILTFKAPKIVPPELRLYYDDTGSVLFYTCEKPEGKYILVDTTVFALARMDLKIVDGKISNKSSYSVVSKLMPCKDTGIECANDDISIIVDSTYNGPKINWKVNVYEL